MLLQTGKLLSDSTLRSIVYTQHIIYSSMTHVDRNGDKKRIAIKKEKEKYRDEIDIAMKCADIWLFSSS